MTMITMHNARLRRHFADQRARDNEGEYVHSAEVRQAVKRQSLGLVVAIVLFIGLTLLGLFCMRFI